MSLSHQSNRHHDSPFADEYTSHHEEDDTVPGAMMHELESSDGESDDDGIAIEADDIDHTIQPEEITRTHDTQPQLHTLPSYQALMASLGTSAAVPSSSSSSSSVATSSHPSTTSSSSSQSTSLDFLQDEVGADVSDDSDDDLDTTSKSGQWKSKLTQTLSFEDMFAKAKRLETKGKIRKAAHYYLFCLEQYRFQPKYQDLIALCLRRLGDICYKSKKCQLEKDILEAP